MSIEPPGQTPPPPPDPNYPPPPPPPEQPVGAPPAGYGQYPAAPPPVGYGQYAAGPPPAVPRRSRAPLIAIGLVVLLVVLAIAAYGVGGFVYAQGLNNSARNTYNGVTDRENKLIDIFNGLSSHTDSTDPNDPTKDAIATDKTYYQQLISQLKSTQPQVDSDLSALSEADSKLKENQWLTVLSRSSLDQAATRIENRRAALAVAKTTVVDYVQYAGFVVALLTAFNDAVTLSDTAAAHDFVGAATAVSSLKTDIATATGLDHAPGLDPDVDSFMHDFLAVANDFGDLLTAATAGDQAGLTRADQALTADGKKLDGHDTAAWASTTKSFFSDLISQYNTANDKANNA